MDNVWRHCPSMSLPPLSLLFSSFLPPRFLHLFLHVVPVWPLSCFQPFVSFLSPQQPPPSKLRYFRLSVSSVYSPLLSPCFRFFKCYGFFVHFYFTYTILSLSRHPFHNSFFRRRLFIVFQSILSLTP